MTLNYFQNIPNGPNNPSQDQPNMKTNTNSIFSIWAIDHITFGNASNGQHAQVTFASNNTPNIPTTPPVLFTKLAASSLPQLFFYSGNAAQSSNQYIDAANGSTFLLGGIILKWGSTASIATNTVVNFASAFPNNCYSVVAVSGTATQSSIKAISASGLTTTGFTLLVDGGSNQTIRYIAIGD